MSRARILADYVAGGTTAAEFDYMDGVTSNVQAQLDAKLPLAGGAMTGAITTNSTFDGVDIAVRDSVLTSTTTTATAAATTGKSIAMSIVFGG